MQRKQKSFLKVKAIPPRTNAKKLKKVSCRTLCDHFKNALIGLDTHSRAC